jgi:hypothetical protein
VSPRDAEIIRLYRDEHLSLRAVAVKAATSTFTVLRVLDEAGVQRRPPGRRPAAVADQADVAAAITDRMTRAQVTSSFGVSKRTVDRIRCGLIPDSGQMVTARQATRITGLSSERLADAAGRGMIRSARAGRGHRWYYRDEIEAFRAGQAAGEIR